MLRLPYRPGFLDERKSGIEPDDHKDCPCQLHGAGDIGQHGREQQQHSQRMGELSGQRAWPGRAAARLQLVRPEAFQPSCGLSLRQPAGVGGQVSQQPSDRLAWIFHQGG